MPSPDITVILPAYNEIDRLPGYLEMVRAYLADRFPARHEILVVDDGSHDGTADLAEQRLGRAGVIRLSLNQGKGAAVRAGMLAAKGELRLFADADGSTPIQEESRLREAILAGADVAAGSRAAPGGVRRWVHENKAPEAPPSEEKAHWEVLPHRHFIGRVFSMLVNGLLGLSLHDTQCGFKMFRAEAALHVFALSKIDRFAFDVEALYLAQRLGYRIAEVPVSWREIPGSKVRLGADSLQMAREVWRLRTRHVDPRPPTGRPPIKKAG